MTRPYSFDEAYERDLDRQAGADGGDEDYRGDPKCHRCREQCAPCYKHEHPDNPFDRYMEQACPKCEGGEGTMCKRHAEEELEATGRA